MLFSELVSIVDALHFPSKPSGFIRVSHPNLFGEHVIANRYAGLGWFREGERAREEEIKGKSLTVRQLWWSGCRRSTHQRSGQADWYRSSPLG